MSKTNPPNLSILDVMRDENLLGGWFDKNDTWSRWMVFLAAFFHVPGAMDDEAVQLFRECTGREKLTDQPYREAWLLVGRRGGKSHISALIAVYLAAFFDYRKYLAPGEFATIMVLAGDKKQARNVKRFIQGFFENVPLLSRMVVNMTAETITLTNRVIIEIAVSNPRGVRGYTLAGVVCDEIATWPSDEISVDRDEETLAALRPAMLTIPHSKLICITSPYAQKGSVWEAYRKHYAQDDSRVLVWKAPTLTMNPSVDRAVIDQAYIDDYEAARAEYGAEFRHGISSLLTRAALDGITLRGVYEIPPEPGRQYLAGFDAASGSGSDSITCAVAHYDHKEGCAVLDACREVKPPFSPIGVVEEFAAFLKTYRVKQVIADQWASGFTHEAFQRCGITLKSAEMPKSDYYLELLPAANSGRIRVLDNARLHAQLLGLERRTARSGKDSVDHAPNGHDDLANSVAIALVSVKARQPMVISPDFLRKTLIPRR